METLDKNDIQWDVIVVGAGYAGLTAARKLIKKGLKIKVLEARDRVGGRIFTKYLDENLYIDLGGQWIGPSQDKIIALTQELGIATFPTYNEGKNRMYFQGKTKDYAGIIPKLSLPALLNLDFIIKKLNRLSKTISLSAPWQSPSAKRMDAITLATWLDKNCWFKATRSMIEVGIQAVFACEPADISLLHALFYIKSGRDLDTLISVTNGAQETRILGGAQAPANQIAEEIKESLVLNTPVKRIEQFENGVKIISQNIIYTAKKVIVAIPPTLCANIEFYPLLPAKRAQLQQRMPMGSVIKCYAIYNQPFWRKLGLNGQVASDNGWVNVTFDNSPYDSSKGILMGFALGNNARELAELPLDERKIKVLNCFKNYLGEQALQVEQYIDHVWADEEWSRGCYAGIMPTGVWTAYGASLRQPVGHIHWAGTETAEIWCGYIDGAIRSGERSADEVQGLMN
jgi:monoamine oxidase